MVILSNLLPYYIRTGFRLYTLLVVHYYNTLMYLYSADIFLKRIRVEYII